MRVSQVKCIRVFLSARRAWCDDCSASSGFVKTPAVGHDCPLFSQQHSCFLIANTQLTSIQLGVSQLVSTSRLKHLHFMQLPRLTSSRPLLHKETSCVQQLRGQFQCFSNQPSSFVQLLIGCVTGVTVFLIATDTTEQKKLGTSKLPGSCLRADQLPEISLHASAGHTLYLVRSAPFVLRATHTWTRARSVPHFRSQPNPYAPPRLSSAGQSRP